MCVKISQIGVLHNSHRKCPRRSWSAKHDLVKRWICPICRPNIPSQTDPCDYNQDCRTSHALYCATTNFKL